MLDAGKASTLMATWLRRVLPSCVEIDANSQNLMFFGSSIPVATVDVASICVEYDDSIDKGLAMALFAAMNQAQDSSIAALHRSWPLGSGANDEGGQHLALPETEVDGDVVRGWYGDRDNPVMSVEIRVADLLE